MGKTKYLMSMGELTRKDFSLVFRVKGKNNYIPIENLTELYIFQEIGLNSKVLELLSKHSVVAHFFNYHGNYVGTYYPKDQYLSGKLLIAQVDAFHSHRLSIAKNLVKAIGDNIYECLYHYYKHDKKVLKKYLDWIKNDFTTSVFHAKTVEELMAYEGELWYFFYDSFKHFLKPDFLMNKRVKRPPDNPINALISFGNTLLYTKTISAIYRTHLDQRISFLHSPSEGRFSLSLDISEPFKPIIVFKTIFELVNNGKLKAEKHFDKEFNYCILNEDGRKIFISAFEERLESKFKHEKLKRFVSYRTAIKYDCYKLIKCILEGKEFVPFRLKDKQ